jgi:excisionase family DNA binding protein
MLTIAAIYAAMESEMKKPKQPQHTRARKPRPNIPALAMTVPEFCEANGISHDLFYALLRRGEAPATMLVGSRRLVSFEAAQAWRVARERSNGLTRRRSQMGGAFFVSN